MICAPADSRTQSATAQNPSGSVSQSAPTQIVERERARLRSDAIEERLDAVLRLGTLARTDAARIAASALDDSSPRVRAAAANALRPLPAAEAAGLLLPLLRDRDEFVRQQAAYALGETGKPAAREIIDALLTTLEEDRSAGVRGAAAVALGRVGDSTAVPRLIESLSRRRGGGGLLNRVRGRRTPENEFVRRSIVQSLGAIGAREAVPALIVVLGDARAEPDVRREAARSLGALGDRSAIPALRLAEADADALLSRTAFESLAELNAANATPATSQPR